MNVLLLNNLKFLINKSAWHSNIDKHFVNKKGVLDLSKDVYNITDQNIDEFLSKIDKQGIKIVHLGIAYLFQKIRG